MSGDTDNKEYLHTGVLSLASPPSRSRSPKVFISEDLLNPDPDTKKPPLVSIPSYWNKRRLGSFVFPPHKKPEDRWRTTDHWDQTTDDGLL